MTKVVASECCSALFAKNTLPGFQHCIDSNYDGIEFDVHLSRDGHVVVQHDYLLNPNITRQSDGQWLSKKGPALCKMSLDEIKAVTVGRYASHSREEKSYPDYEPLDNVTIPTLKEFISVYHKANSQADLLIELKTSPFQRSISSDPVALTQAVVKLVSDAGIAPRCVLLAFEWSTLKLAESLSGEIRTNFLTINHAAIASMNKVDVDPTLLYGEYNPEHFHQSIPGAIAAAGGDYWGPYVQDVQQDDIEQAHQHNLEVNLWGVESTDSGIDKAIRLEADAITLSNPGLLRTHMASDNHELR